MDEDKFVMLFKELFGNFRDYNPEWFRRLDCEKAIWLDKTERCEIFSKRATVLTVLHSSCLLSIKLWSIFGKITWMDEYG